MEKYENLPTLERPVSVLRGVGEAREAALRKIGLETVGDVISFYPRAYQNRGMAATAAEVKEKVTDGTNGPFSMILTVAAEPEVKMIRRGMVLMKLKAFDETGVVHITYFNQQYLKQKMPTGSTFRFFGKVTYEYNSLQMNSPITEPYYDGVKLDDIVPVYPLTTGLSQKFMANLAREALKLAAADLREYLPLDALSELSLPSYSYALNNIHAPSTVEAIENSKRRLIFDELYLLSLSMNLRGNKARRTNYVKASDCDLSEFYAQLKFELTGAQKRCVDEISADMSGERLMNRILTGDVGSGKTVVAAAAAYIAVKNGYRAAVMAPTEILAEQHANKLSEIFTPLGINCALLTGSTGKKTRTLITEGLSGCSPMNKIDIIIGTHALITEGIQIENLGLAVIDEQHRFGVKQRAALFEKAENVHCLVMSATPIPRTMTLANYGSIDLSRIDELPKGRQKIDTFVVNESYHQRLLAFIRKQSAEGHQTYVVCPAVEENKDKTKDDNPENIGNINLIDDLLAEENESAPPMKAAESVAAQLTAELPELKVGLIHGRMKSADKDFVMKAFERREIDVLVSTTVIEVGVDVPNATLMIVENAERFGLSALHQLRGRVGRGQFKSYFILVSDAKNPKSKERLKAIKSTTDGFKIAEYDLEQRGPGDFFNESGVIRQSGEMSFALAASCTDVNLMERASFYAKRTAEDDPEMRKPENKPAYDKVVKFTSRTEKMTN